MAREILWFFTKISKSSSDNEDILFSVISLIPKILLSMHGFMFSLHFAKTILTPVSDMLVA